MKTGIFFLIGSVMLVFACNAQSSEYSFKEQYKVSAPASLTISSSDGFIDVTPADGNEIQVFYIVRKNGKTLKISRQELEEEMNVEVVHNESALKISISSKKDYKFILGDSRPDVSFRIQVPKETACDLHTSDGNITVKNLKGDQQGKTSDGDIRFADIRGAVTGATSDGNVKVATVYGPVEIRTSDGDIQLEDIEGRVEARTSDGTIRLTRVKGELNAKTSDGNVFFEEVSGTFTASTSDGNIRGNMIALTNALNFRTGDGNIDVTVPGNIGMDLTIRGESLEVPLKNFSGKSDKNFIQGKSNGGGVAVDLSTGDGHVRLAYR